MRNELLTALVEAVAQIADRIKTIEAPTTAEIETAVAAWLAVHAESLRGASGAAGKDGSGPTAADIQLSVDIWLELNRELLRGANGKDGSDGADGADGVAVQGARGADGNKGDAGFNGKDGVGVARVDQIDETQFFIVLTNGMKYAIGLPRVKKEYLGGFGGGGGSGSGNGMPQKIVQIATSTSFDVTPTLILADASAGPLTITLPETTTNNRSDYVVMKTDSSANLVTVKGGGSNINLQPQFEISRQFTGVHIYSTASPFGYIIA